MRRIFSVVGIFLFVLSACSAAPAQTALPDEPVSGEPEATSLPDAKLTAMPTDNPTPYPQPDVPMVDDTSAQPYPLPVTGFEPKPGDENLVRGTIFIELADSGLLVMESYPVQVNMHLSGSLPNPCHQLRVFLKVDQAQYRVDLDAYSVVDSSEQCIEVIQELDETLPLGSFYPGHYSVYLNGELLGEFDA